jgi:hypothetical protein
MIELNNEQHLLSTSVHPNTLTLKRRIHGNGVQVLENKYEIEDQKHKMQIMENRIKRLEFEENRANNLARNAEAKANLMIERRKQHFQDLISKKRAISELKTTE